MEMIEVVENPRRRRRRYTALQRAYGFGGRPARRRRRARRRNPALATLAGNPRRRRRSYGAYRVRRAYRRRHNPRFAGVDLGAVLWVGLGGFGSRAVPRLVQKFYPALPTTGIMGYLIRAGGAFASAYAVRMVTRSPRAFGLVLTGGLGLIVLDLLVEQVAPHIGLAGLAQDDTRALTVRELTDIYGEPAGVSGYVDVGPTGRALSGYVDIQEPVYG